MSRIENAFKNGKTFIGFLTAGDPSLDKTEEFVLKMVEAGADLIEIGIPFSDPIAEGEVIQDANIRALSAGATVEKVFQTVKSIRSKTEVPLVFLTYLNPVFHYGYEEFLNRCNECGVDGIIIPDMPYEEKKEILPIARRYEVDIISMIAPTSEQRIEMIAREATGFVYVVSSLGVTGVRSEIKTDLESIVGIVKKNTDTPVAIGFGINTCEQAKHFSQFADGVIVGSAIVRIIGEYGENAGQYLYDYVHSMKKSVE